VMPVKHLYKPRGQYPNGFLSGSSILLQPRLAPQHVQQLHHRLRLSDMYPVRFFRFERRLRNLF
jgi:hypothetical protein